MGGALLRSPAWRGRPSAVEDDKQENRVAYCKTSSSQSRNRVVTLVRKYCGFETAIKSCTICSTSPPRARCSAAKRRSSGKSQTVPRQARQLSGGSAVIFLTAAGRTAGWLRALGANPLLCRRAGTSRAEK